MNLTANPNPMRLNCALVCTFLILSLGTGSDLAAQDQAAPFPQSEAFLRVCSSCHDAERILSNRRTRTQWEEVIEKMVERGAEGTDADFTAVEEYLLQHFGRVNVNKALPKDIVAVLDVAPKDGDAIVAFRKASGDFADFEALCKVPGIDVEKLKKARDGISY
ncbi:MAG: helix-hairpin-helix domain-containing protein [Acidobacteriota bacterium]